MQTEWLDVGTQTGSAERTLEEFYRAPGKKVTRDRRKCGLMRVWMRIMMMMV